MFVMFQASGDIEVNISNVVLLSRRRKLEVIWTPMADEDDEEYDGEIIEISDPSELIGKHGPTEFR